MKNKAAPPTGAEITRRLQIVSELRDLCLSLGKVKRIVSPQEPAATRPAKATAK